MKESIKYPKIIQLKEQGFCYGVTRALKIALDASTNNEIPRPIYLLGDLVHNDHIHDLLVEQNIIVLNGDNRLSMLDQINSGTVIFTAHGVSQKVRNKALSKNLHIIDATCPYVEKTFSLVTDAVKDDKNIIYVGKVNHPETEAITEACDKVILFNDSITLDPNLSYYVAHQTTMSRFDISGVMDKLRKMSSNVFYLDMICNITEKRQKSLDNIEIDSSLNNLIIVIGDTKSNNSTKLYELAKRKCHNALFIESVGDLKINTLVNFDNIYITSGTSTPLPIINEVVSVLNDKSSYSLESIKSKVTVNDLKI